MGKARHKGMARTTGVGVARREEKSRDMVTWKSTFLFINRACEFFNPFMHRLYQNQIKYFMVSFSPGLGKPTSCNIYVERKM